MLVREEKFAGSSDSPPQFRRENGILNAVTRRGNTLLFV
jgi:hypothetical protein